MNAIFKKFILLTSLIWSFASLPVAQTTKILAVPSQSPESAAIFVDKSTETGLDFTHFNGMTGKLYLPEIMGSGAALFDYDRDGDLDVFLSQGRVLEPGKTNDEAVLPWKAKHEPTGRLFRNDLKTLPDGKTILSFTDVTEASGLSADGYGFGVAVGDINNDGFPDIYLCNLESNKLYLNNNDGTFKDVTSDSKTDDPRWSIGASFFDYDRDGFLDLMVVNYADFNIKKAPDCYSKTTAPDYCGPRAYRAVGNSLFRNRGNGTFENVTAPTGISKDFGHGLGVVAADLNEDDWTDIYVANDGDANQLWINQKDGTFLNDAFFSGSAVNQMGQAEASMGVDAGDFNGDGKLDLFITHLMEETHTLYANEGKGIFEDITAKTNLGLPDKRLTGFGTSLFDFDNDGYLDIFVANGSVKLLKEVNRPGNQGLLNPKFPLGQKNQLFRNLGDGTFSDVSESAGESFSDVNVSRGAAFGDIDNDGDTDIVVVNNSGRAELLINSGNNSNWLGFSAIEKAGGRDMLGAKIAITLSSKRILYRRFRTDGSYSSAQDPRVVAGLGPSDTVTEVRVTWPDGSSEKWTNPGRNKYVELVKGTGNSK